MKFEDIPAQIMSIRVKSTDSPQKDLDEQPIQSVTAYQSRPGNFEIHLKDCVAFVEPTVKADIRRLDNELSQGHSYLAQLTNPAVDGSIELQIAFFSGQCLPIGDIDLGVDEYVETSLNKIHGRPKHPLSGHPLYRILEGHCTLKHGNEVYFFLTAGPAIDDTLNAKSEAREHPSESSTIDAEVESAPKSKPTRPKERAPSPEVKPTRKNSLCITGDRIRFVATETQIQEGPSIYLTNRLTQNKTKMDRAIRLAKGKLNFVDWTQAGQIQILCKAQLSRLTDDDDSYLKKWDEFGDLEGEILLKQARDFGSLQYCDATPERDGTVTVRITSASDSALQSLGEKNDNEIQIVENLPDYLINPDLKFSEFASCIEQEVESHIFDKKRKKEQSDSNSYLVVLDFDPASRSLKIEAENLAQSGILIRSLAGEIAQIKRRMSARKDIQTGRSANRQLGLLIEEKGQITPTRSPHKIKPLTAFVKDKIFEDAPTIMQKMAIEVALNTPDICLIQGPPGTGKTTVIAAIIERLNEIADKQGVSIKGKVLLTGFQHDAVENMIASLSLNGIPVPKFGKRSGADHSDFNVFEKNLEDWCASVAVALQLQNPQIDEIKQETEIKNLCLQYIKVPTQQLAVILAKRIASLDPSIIDELTARNASRLVNKLSSQGNSNAVASLALDSVRRLRIRPESFSDDGPDRASDALDELKGMLDQDQVDLLDRASLWNDKNGSPAFLDDLSMLKKELLIHFTTPPVFRVDKQNNEIIELCQKAILQIRKKGISAKDAKCAALAEFLAELESNPYGMIDAVSDYSFAFAATCQQSVNKQMQIQKGITGNSSDHTLEYEYVIVDEAARVSPRDLMVPMAQGKRIILVGDHRQLPHIIDEEVARKMEDAETGEDESDWLKKSMFQYLFSERLKALEKQDGIKRRVTLDTQFRMHPQLGDFISRNFYERFDSSEKFESGRDESDFVHNLPGTDNKSAIWLDVPSKMGNYDRCGTSWTREAEAKAIVKQLKEWMDHNADQDLSFGVISFYKAQAELIKKELGRHTYDESKLRIGTVDSFQGMEFDVVFLSMVRTMPKHWNSADGEKEKDALRLFGHLGLYNRLNVSMSRQKKLLVLVGDSGLIHGDLASQFIPGLVDFFNLCQTKGRILQCH